MSTCFFLNVEKIKLMNESFNENKTFFIPFDFWPSVVNVLWVFPCIFYFFRLLSESYADKLPTGVLFQNFEKTNLRKIIT